MEPINLKARAGIDQVLTAAAVATLTVVLALPAALWLLVVFGVLPPGFCAR